VLPMPHLGKAEIGHLNALFQRNHTAFLDLPGGGRYSISFITTRPPLHPRMSVRLRIEDTEVQVHLSEIFIARYLEHRYPGEEFGQLPADLRSLVLEAILAELLAQAEKKLGIGISVTGVSFDAQAAPDGKFLSFCLTEKESLQQIFGLISQSEQVLPLIAALMQELPVRQRNWDNLPLPLRIEVGTTLLPLSALNEVAVGDVVLLDGSAGRRKNEVGLRLPSGPTFLGQLEAGKVVVVRSGGEDMADEIDRDMDDEPLIEDVDELPVRLVFDIGTKDLTIGELRALAPGFAFDLDRDLTSPVTIRVNGRAIGSGELVEVDSRLGVRITDLFRTGDE
jgi:type III secretion system apparatus protein YscQ/HrcQ